MGARPDRQCRVTRPALPLPDERKVPTQRIESTVCSEVSTRCTKGHHRTLLAFSQVVPRAALAMMRRRWVRRRPRPTPAGWASVQGAKKFTFFSGGGST
eukprot:scaffold693_cov399-Prasinococcus_capsulatus_cf.AAC.23